MKRFKNFFLENIEEVELDEAVEVSHDRYMRSHGKKARDSGQGSGNWMFTHKSMGDVDYNDEKQVHNARGKFADAKKSAQKWAKEHGHRTVYVMESVELDEEVELDEQTMPGNVALRLVDRHQAAAFHHKKNGNMKGYASHFKVAERIEDAVIRAGRDMPVKSKQLEAASDKAFKEHPHRVVKNEEVELDEAKKPKPGHNAAVLAKNISKALGAIKKEEAEINEASGLRITKVYNKFPKKATYAVHNADRSYFKEFDDEADAKKHLETKK